VKRLFLLGVCLAAALSLVWGCASMDYTSVASIALKTAPKVAQASRPINESEEYYVGRAVAARILGTNRLVTDQQLTLYVNEVGQTVARKSPRPTTYKGYHFAVLDTSVPNAFACPGGIIFITKGLVETCSSEDELAAVLAHEVAHVANKDGINSISKARWTEVLTTLGTETAKQYAGPGGQLVTLFEGSIDDVFKTIVVNGYSRSAEEAADAQAVTTLRNAGYDPGAMASVLNKMMAKSSTGGGIFKTHPPTADRLAKIKTAAAGGAPDKMEEVRTKRFQSVKM
jgi:predicted Zn-dependent protease